MKIARFPALVGLCFLCAAGALPSGAQTTGQGSAEPSSENAGSSIGRETDFEAWKKVCVQSPTQEREVCGLAYAGAPETPASLITEDSPLIAATVQSVKSGKGTQLILVIRTRLGLLLPGGLKLRIDKKKPVKAAFRSCHASRVETGCLVPIRLDGTFARNLKRGLTLTITAKTLQGDSMSQQISLLGITSALNALPPA
ncbi:MAG: invasion associated locus B family protein [Roseibium sp.]|uniref:invasion associated locus B family protein n=1 Tax=Roseibium sp. TaxID=1936156 RepID=UPI002616D1C5|nr:invasion associated locus B family protein [Roseibium sp.]MCV0424647.1 invasion associated locus B family protein [Roseibium sp.]